MISMEQVKILFRTLKLAEKISVYLGKVLQSRFQMLLCTRKFSSEGHRYIQKDQVIGIYISGEEQLKEKSKKLLNGRQLVKRQIRDSVRGGLAGTCIFQLKSVEGCINTATGTCIDHLQSISKNLRESSIFPTIFLSLFCSLFSIIFSSLQSVTACQGYLCLTRKKKKEHRICKDVQEQSKSKAKQV